MKLNKIVLTLTAAALLPTFAYAGTDAVATSFERDLYRDPINSAAMIAGEADPLTVEFNAALYGKADPVLASFERDLYRDPVNSAAVIAGEDPLAVAFHAALRNELGKPVVQATVTGSRRLGS